MSDEPQPGITNREQWDKHVELLTVMCHDELTKSGPTPGGFIQNLRMIADKLDAYCVTEQDIKDWRNK